MTFSETVGASNALLPSSDAAVTTVEGELLEGAVCDDAFGDTEASAFADAPARGGKASCGAAIAAELLGLVGRAPLTGADEGAPLVDDDEEAGAEMSDWALAPATARVATISDIIAARDFMATVSYSFALPIVVGVFEPFLER